LFPPPLLSETASNMLASAHVDKIAAIAQCGPHISSRAGTKVNKLTRSFRDMYLQ
jgi:hypothetical protein